MSLELEYDGPNAASPALTPERRLYLAIVRRAIWDFVLYKKSKNVEKRALAREAEGWLFWPGEEDTDAEGRVTFQYVCSILNVDPARIRHSAKRLKRTDIQRLTGDLKD